MKSQKGYAVAAAAPRHLSLSPLVKRLWLHLKRWHQLAQERRQLASMNDAMLKDLGLSRADVMQETERPFWDDPLAK